MDPTTPVIAKQWLPKLGKELRQIVSRRRLEIENLNEIFRFDPDELARRYVEPYVQFSNPVDAVGRASLIQAQPERLQLWLNRFLKTEIRGPERGGQHVLFLLGDAGMGKTSAMLMLKLWHLTSFWPPSLRMELLKLGPKTLAQVEKIEQKNRTVLLLDALDEDPEARRGIAPRLEVLLQQTDAFRQVVLTCRTQFFPRGGPTPMESAGKVVVAGYECNMLYLSPFFDDQVDEYLEKAFPNRGLWWLRHRLSGSDNARLRRAKALLRPMRDLRIRPLLLSYVDDLLDESSSLGSVDSYRIFHVLVEKWLLREERKQRKQARTGPGMGPVLSREQLRRACRLLAYEMFRRDRSVVTSSELLDLLDQHELQGLSTLDLGGRSLLNRTAKPVQGGEEGFRFAHRTIQEFLVVEHLAQLVTAGEQVEPLAATDEMVRFYLSAARFDGEFAELTSLLRVDSVENLAALIWPEQEGVSTFPAARWQFPGLHFSGADLEGRDFSGLDLQGINFAQANLSGADLSKAQLTECRWDGANLDGAHWHGATVGRISLDLFHHIDTEQDGRVSLWRAIPAGEGWIGSPSEEQGHQSNEGPRHRVSIERPFSLTAVPITNAQYAVFDPEKADSDRPSHPVVNVTWEDATNFCRWLSELPGFAGARLPTEEEWEYACRGGTTTHYWSGNAESDLARVGWYDKNSEGRTHPVGEKLANPWGLYDMHGNVWEWTATPWGEKQYQGRSAESPFRVDPAIEPEDLAARPGVRRVLRGGGCGDAADGARSAFRSDGDPRFLWRNLGFRVLLPRPPAGGRS